MFASTLCQRRILSYTTQCYSESVGMKHSVLFLLMDRKRSVFKTCSGCYTARGMGFSSWVTSNLWLFLSYSAYWHANFEVCIIGVYSNQGLMLSHKAQQADCWYLATPSAGKSSLTLKLCRIQQNAIITVSSLLVRVLVLVNQCLEETWSISLSCHKLNA